MSLPNEAPEVLPQKESSLHAAIASQQLASQQLAHTAPQLSQHQQLTEWYDAPKGQSQHQAYDMPPALHGILYQLCHAMERLCTDVGHIHNDIGHMQRDIGHMQRDIAYIKEDMRQVKADLSQLKEDMREMKADVLQLKEGVSQLREDVRDVNTEVVLMKDYEQSTRQEVRDWRQDVSTIGRFLESNCCCRSQNALAAHDAYLLWPANEAGQRPPTAFLPQTKTELLRIRSVARLQLLTQHYQLDLPEDAHRQEIIRRITIHIGVHLEA